jgi:diguanylate cyclase (GGDEF)-like protein
MLLPFIVYVVALVMLLAVAALVPSVTKVTVVVALGVVLAGAGAMLYYSGRYGDSKLRQLVKLYLQRLEQMHSDFISRRQVDRQVADLARFIFDAFHITALALVVKKKQGYVVTDVHGVPPEKIKQLCISHQDELIRAMETRRSVVPLHKVYAGGKITALLSELPFKEAMPILSGGKCSHLILLTHSTAYPMRLMRPFLLALADQIGDNRLLDDLLNKHNQQVGRLRRQLDSANREKESKAKSPVFDARAMINAQDRLMRIHNRDQLYESLLQLIKEQFKVDFAAVLLRKQENGNYEARYGHNMSKELASRLFLPADCGFAADLKNHPGWKRSDQVADFAPDKAVQRILQETGVSAIGVLGDIEGSESVMAVGRVKSGFSDEELEAAYSYCRLFNLVLENQAHFEKIEQMSYTDSMTGLYNYRYFYKRLQEEMTRAKRFDRRMALVIFDIDEFKVFNDTYGHQSGDHLLEQLGSLLAKSVRSIDVVSRYGGEEFCVIMPETSAEDCSNFMDRMRVTVLNHEFRDRFTSEQHRITVSLGGAIYPNDAQRIDRLIYCADMALLQAKSSGRNRSFMFDEKLLSSRSDRYDKKTNN